MKQRLAPLFILLLLGGCASLAQFQQFMDGYIGQPITAVQEAFGYNFIERPLEGGRKAYTWHWVRHRVTAAYPSSAFSFGLGWHGRHGMVALPSWYYAPTYYEDRCEFTFITNPQLNAQEHVIAWRARGEGCARYRPETVLRSKPVG